MTLQEGGAPVNLTDVLRGGVVESRHYGSIAITGADGSLRMWAGEPGRRCFLRSSSKPIQAVPLVESGAADAFGLTEVELAVACGSHSGEDVHADAVRSMLGKAGLDPAQLRNGPPDSPIDDRLRQNCSGNHAGVMVTARHLGLDVESYVDLAHPVEQRIREVHAHLAGIDVDAVEVGVDGCSIVCFALSLVEMSRAFANFCDPAYAAAQEPRLGEALSRLSQAMMNQPLMVAGTNGHDTDLMEAAPGLVCCKGGAESVWCFGFPSAGGAAFKVEDGSFRPKSVIAVDMLRQAGLLPPDAIDRFAAKHLEPIFDARGNAVGEMRPAFTLVGA
jgi:L-asparaginase II